MKILIIGSGGREHALAWKIRQSPLVREIFCLPGNAGTDEIAKNIPMKMNDHAGILAFAREQNIDLTVVGPEQPLTEGIVDLFTSQGMKIFGPTKAAAEIEGSKVFAKHFMKKYNIPTAEFRTFNVAERYDAERYINEVPVPIVLKADGLAAGKGVTVCESKEQALEVLSMMMDEKHFGDAGNNVVIEELLVGEEASVFAITDGREFITLSPAQDHKRILDDDLGKNTGGMGAYAPALIITEEMMDVISRTIIRPTLIGMANEKRLYRGCLYVGLMITPTGPKVIEYNCRFGDPETQVVLPLIDDDIVPLLLDAADGTMQRNISFKKESAVCVIVASGGYPDRYEAGKPIMGLHEAGKNPNILLFHSGTKKEDDTVLTAGGRVLGVTAIGERQKLEETIDAAYRAVEKIRFDGMYYRSDIGKKGLRHIHQFHSTENQ